MRTLFFLLLTLFYCFRTFAQEVNWQKATNWTIYNVQNRNIWSLPVDSLAQFSHTKLNNDSMRLFLANITVISPKENPIWMGLYAATCIVDNIKRKIEISTYGGFFYDDYGKKYYQIPPNIQKDWLNFLGNSPGIQSVN